MRLLVSGGAGFIGSHLVERLLKNGNSVTVVDNFNNYYSECIKRRNLKDAIKNKKFKLVKCDVRDSHQMKKILEGAKFDCIIHLAGMAGVRESLINPLLYNDVNVGGTLNLLELARKYRTGRFIFASSSSVYGNSRCFPFCEEDRNPAPLSPYGISKLLAEYYCKIANKVYGLQCTVLRLFSVYGPRQRPDMAIHKFARSIMGGREITIFGSGNTKRDYTFVSDIVSGIDAAISKYPRTTNFEIFNLGNSQMVKLSYVIKLLEDALKKKAKIKILPERSCEPSQTLADISKARKELGYKPLTPIEKGIPEFTDWLKKYY